MLDENLYKTISSLLADLVELIESYGGDLKHLQKEELLLLLSKLEHLTHKLGSVIPSEIQKLIKLAPEFLQDPKAKKEKLLAHCLAIKNELWEL